MKPKIYYAQDHDIDPGMIDPDVFVVLDKLRSAGHTAYLVGGSVRDLLVKKIPKDYDFSTSARPEEIKAIFGRQCILIGRRFRLAHVRFGRKIFEVSTFRAGEEDEGLITQDNVWGTPEEDVRRRDFTINGFFYDSSNHSIIDYVGGWDDLQKHVLKTIGKAETRFKQDPVRILRLIKFIARFGFKVDPESERAIHHCKKEIVKSSSARVLEEFLKMLESGYSAKFIKLLQQYDLLPILMPNLSDFLRLPEGNTIYHYLGSADQLYHHKGKNCLDRSILTSCILYPMLEKAIDKVYLSKNQVPHLGQITVLASELIRDIFVSSFSHFPRRISGLMNSILISQFRFTPLSGKRHYRSKMFQHREFEDALNFLKLRAFVNESLVETYTSIRNQHRQMDRHPEKKHHPGPRHNRHRS